MPWTRPRRWRAWRAGRTASAPTRRGAAWRPNLLPRPKRKGLPSLYLEQFRSLLLLLMVVFENVHALNARSETRSIFRIPVTANPFLILAIIGGQGIHIGAMHLPGLSELLRVEPIRIADRLLVSGLAASLIVVVEAYKAAAARRARGG